jgi:uncharacterized damage-inducible protein DinB
MKTLEELSKEYDMAQRVVLEKTIEITLFNNGVDPERVSMKDFDQLRRLSIEIDKINDRTSEAISKLQAAAQEEINAVVSQLEELTLKIKARQHAEDHPDEIKGETPVVEQAPATDDSTASATPIIEELKKRELLLPE